MTNEKIVEALEKIDYEVFEDEAEPEEVENLKKYCVYYKDTFTRQDQKMFTQNLEFVFVHENFEDFDEFLIIDALEQTGLFFKDASYGKLKKVNGGDIVNCFTMHFARPKKRKCNY